MQRLLALISSFTLTFSSAEEPAPPATNLDKEVELHRNGQTIKALIFEVTATTLTFLHITQAKSYTVQLDTLTPESRSLCAKFHALDFRGIKLGTTISEFQKIAIKIGAETHQMSNKDNIAAYALNFKYQPENMLAGTEDTAACASNFLFSFWDSRLVAIVILRGNAADKKPLGENESMNARSWQQLVRKGLEASHDTPNEPKALSDEPFRWPKPFRQQIILGSTQAVSYLIYGYSLFTDSITPKEPTPPPPTFKAKL